MPNMDGLASFAWLRPRPQHPPGDDQQRLTASVPLRAQLQPSQTAQGSAQGAIQGTRPRPGCVIVLFSPVGAHLFMKGLQCTALACLVKLC